MWNKLSSTLSSDQQDRFEVVIPSENFLALCGYVLRFCKCNSSLQPQLVESMREIYHGVDKMNNTTNIQIN